MSRKSKKNIYQNVTDRIVELMNSEGLVPWQFPWNNVQANIKTGNPYNGFNIMWLDLIQYIAEYSTPWWCTYKQAQSLGGQVRRDETGTGLTFFQRIEKKDANGEPTGEWFGFHRGFVVFNADQIDWPEDFKIPSPLKGDFDKNIEAESVIWSYIEREDINFVEGGNQASHNVAGNSTVRMPVRELFRSEWDYYKTFFHEIVHSTRHPSRLDRKKTGTENGYSYEELVAEMGAAMLANILGFPPEMDEYSAQYIKGWADVFEDDVKMVIKCAGMARLAVDYILGETES